MALLPSEREMQAPVPAAGALLPNCPSGQSLMPAGPIALRRRGSQNTNRCCRRGRLGNYLLAAVRMALSGYPRRGAPYVAREVAWTVRTRFSSLASATAEHACHCGDREDGLIRAHELEDPGRYRSGLASKPSSHSRENVALLALFLPEALMADASRNFIV